MEDEEAGDKNGQTSKTPRPDDYNGAKKDDNGKNGQKLVADKSDQKTNIEPYGAGITGSKSLAHSPKNEINVGSHLIRENSFIRAGTDIEGDQLGNSMPFSIA